MRITLEGISHEALAGVTALVNSKDNDLNRVLADLGFQDTGKKVAMMNLAELDIHSTSDRGTTFFTVTIEIEEKAPTVGQTVLPVSRKYLDMLFDSLQVFPKEVKNPK